ncbi:MAG: cupredoxin domain-containing protein [Acidimicrobiales bacterium]
MAEQIVAPGSEPAAPGGSGRPRRWWWLPLLLAACTAVALGCGSSTEESSLDESAAGAPTSTTSVPEAGSEPTYMMGKCTFRMPGEILSAEEAVVWFSTDHVCPGYVTVAPGTEVTFANEDTSAHSVAIAEGAMPGGAEIARASIEPGETWVRSFDSVGSFTYTTDAIPTFLGTIEVTDSKSHA